MQQERSRVALFRPDPHCVATYPRRKSFVRPFARFFFLRFLHPFPPFIVEGVNVRTFRLPTTILRL